MGEEQLIWGTAGSDQGLSRVTWLSCFPQFRVFRSFCEWLFLSGMAVDSSDWC